MGPARLQTSTHTFVHYYDLTDLINEYDKLLNQYASISNLTNANHVYQRELTNYNNIVQYYKNLIDEKLSPFRKIPRTKRGLINGLGSIIKQISGNLDADDGNHFESLIENLQQNQNSIIKQINQQYSINNQIIENFNKTIEDIEHNELLMVSRIKQLESIMTTTISHTDMLFAKDLINQIINLLNIILNIIQDTENSITFCKSNILHPSIITSEELLRELMKISDFYDKQLPFPATSSQIHNYESIITPRCAIKGYQIFYFMTIPLLNSEQYELFYFLPLPNKQLSVIVPSSSFGLKSKTMLLPLKSSCVQLNDVHQCQRNQITLANNTCERDILFKNSFSSCSYQKLQIEENSIEFVPELQGYIGTFIKKELIKEHCQDSWSALERTGTFLFENSSCTTYVQGRPLIFNDASSGQPLHLQDFNMFAKKQEDSKLPELKIKHLTLKKLDTNIQPLTPISAVPKTTHFHTSAIILIYLIIVAAAIWITSRLIQRRRKRTLTSTTDVTTNVTNTPEVENRHPDNAKF